MYNSRIRYHDALIGDHWQLFALLLPEVISDISKLLPLSLLPLLIHH